MLTRGNHKLGGRAIWAFSLPSGTRESCPGSSELCQTHCYARRLERYRSAAAAKYRQNLAAAQQRDFVRRVRAFLILHRVRIVRVHVGGDFFNARYARKWLQIIRRSPRTLFYFYTRSWRVSSIREMIDQMAELSNCRVWFSCDRETDLPATIPPRVRVAWLMTDQDDTPPLGTDLVFRIRRLRRQPVIGIHPPICPSEASVVRGQPMTCDRCSHCWHPMHRGRVPLSIIDFPSSSNPIERR